MDGDTAGTMVFKKAKGMTEYAPGESVNDLFVVRFKKPVRTTRTGNFFFQLKIQDALGDSMLSYFGGEDRLPVQALYDSISPDDVIRVVGGRAEDYKGSTSFVVDLGGKIEVLKEGEFSVGDFVKSSAKERNEMLDETLSIFNSIKNEKIRLLVGTFYEDQTFLERFAAAPGAMYRHHGWLSGLMEHTLAIAKIVRNYASIQKELDLDLLTAGALLHDIGKMRELEATTTIKVTDDGNLLGHVVLGLLMADRRFSEVDAPEQLKNKLLHMMACHHGKPEYGAPKEPAFPEAMVVHLADSMDALASAMISAKENADTEDSFIYTKDFGNVYLK